MLVEQTPIQPGRSAHKSGEREQIAQARALVRGLPADHPYHRCNHENYFRVVARLLKGAWQNRSNDAAMHRWRTQS